MVRAREGRAGHLCLSAALLAAMATGGCDHRAVGDRTLTARSATTAGGEARPLRLLSLVPQVTELALSLGAGDLLVGRTTDTTHPTLRFLPVVGDPVRPEIETIAWLRPDLVVAWTGADLEPAPFDQPGPRVVEAARRLAGIFHPHPESRRTGCSP